MDFFTAIFLGIVQGFLEFLPVSSSLHLSLLHQSIGTSPLFPVFPIICHGGTLASCLWFFRKDFREKLAKRDNIRFLFLALLPLSLGYLLYKNIGSFVAPCWGLRLSALILLIASCAPEKRLVFTPEKRSALFLGSMQALALFPGVSRSGATVGAGLLRGWSTEEAVRISFLLSIPTILAAMFVETMEIVSTNEAIGINAPQAFLGFFTAFLSGNVGIRFVERAFQKQGLRMFSVYLFCFSFFSQ